MITKILASTAAISFALTATAFAQDKSATKPSDEQTKTSQTKTTEDGLGAIIAIGAVDGGGGGKVDVQDINIIKHAKDPKLGPIKGESAEKVMGGGEDRLTENVTLNFEKAQKIDDIEGESLDRAQGEGFVPLAGAALGAKSPACVTESGAVDADCNGLPDNDAEDKDTRFDRRDIRKRPEPRQQRR